VPSFCGLLQTQTFGACQRENYHYATLTLSAGTAGQALYAAESPMRRTSGAKECPTDSHYTGDAVDIDRLDRDSSKSVGVFSLAGGLVAGAGDGRSGRCGVFHR
jgi:hypothetical protein